ncbi:hypothetical protein HYC85_014998 [Camellia sinensis]|uniref:Exostosin GT47 domain-containing protein n=1 Tax=Camellia sinensis TaxID=4442 RepID=A0A7J7H9X4_CAMSI|nr:hypothetical protein HYC85_014998 [Camellia sinensis]
MSRPRPPSKALVPLVPSSSKSNQLPFPPLSESITQSHPLEMVNRYQVLGNIYQPNYSSTLASDPFASSSQAVSVTPFPANPVRGHTQHLTYHTYTTTLSEFSAMPTLPKDSIHPKTFPFQKSISERVKSRVASPRVVEAIYAECIPVLISKGYVPPFSDVLNWKAFSISMAVKDIPNIKKILMGISQNQYFN